MMSWMEGNPPRKRPRLLVIPHTYVKNLRIREVELAKALTPYFDVFLLTHASISTVGEYPFLKRRLLQGKVLLQGIFTSIREIGKKDGVHLLAAPFFSLPIVQRFFGYRRGAEWGRRFHGWVLKEIVTRFQISHLLLGSMEFYIPSSFKGITLFDLVDWWNEEDHTEKEIRDDLRGYFSYIQRRADGILVVSSPLKEKLKKEWGLEGVPIPNGADLSSIRNVSREEVERLRNDLGLTGKFVVGSVGNHGSYYGVDFLLKVLEIAQKKIPQIVFLFLGPIAPWKDLLSRHPLQENLRIVGPVPPEKVPLYLHLLNVGVLCHTLKPSPLYSFPITLVEYSAARIPVISVQYLVAKALSWPHVFLREMDPNLWAETLYTLQSFRWNPSWDDLLLPYDWKEIGKKVREIFLEKERKREKKEEENSLSLSPPPS